MPDSPIFESFYNDRAKAAGNDLCVNLYAEHVDGDKGPEVGLLVSRQGLSAPVYSLGNGPVNGLFVSRISGGMYAASGTNIYFIATPGATPVVIGTILANNAQVSFAENATQVFIIDGQGAWVYTKATGVYAQVIPNTATSAQYPGTLVYQDGFVLVNSGGTNQLYQSNYGDLSNFATPNGGNLGSTANNAYAQGDSTNIVAIAGLHHEVWVFKQRVTEVWINQGSAGFAFAQLQGVYMQFGCMAPNSIELVGESLVWLGQDANGDCVALVSEGYKAKIVSTPSLTQIWNAYTNQTDAIAYAYQLDGHYFYVLTFPTGNETYVYDLVTGKWHQRGIFTNGSYARELANCYEVFGGVNLVGDYASGNIYALSDNNLTDNGKAIRWLRRWSALPSSASMVPLMSFDSLQVLMETGLALPQATQSAMFLYATNRFASQIDMMSSAYLSGSLSSLPTYSQPVSNVPTKLAVTPNNKFAYCGQGGAPGKIYQYSIGNDGELTALSPATVSALLITSHAMAISPDGLNLYAPSITSGTITQLAISASGALSVLSPQYVGSTSSVSNVVIHPNGGYVYVAENSTFIGVYSRNASNGKLTEIGSLSVGGNPTVLSIHPNGQYLYCMGSSNNLNQFSINQFTGLLAPLSTQVIAGQNNPFQCMTIRKDGNYLYLGSGGSNTNNNQISWFAIAPGTGQLSFVGNSIMPAGSEIFDIDFSSDNTIAYVADQVANMVRVFSVNITTGALAFTSNFSALEATPGPNHVTAVTLTGVPSQANPQVMLRWSDDGGYTWTNYFSMSAGLIGSTAWRVIQNRLGSATIGRGQQRIFEISSVDQFQAKIYGAVIEGGPA